MKIFSNLREKLTARATVLGVLCLVAQVFTSAVFLVAVFLATVFFATVFFPNDTFAQRGRGPQPARLRQGFAQASFPGATVGQNPLTGANCRGFGGDQPNYIFEMAQAISFTISTDSRGGDPTLMLRLPNGTVLCDDDSGEGNNAQLTVNGAQGRVEVWVGSYSRGQRIDYQINLRERQAPQAADARTRVSYGPQSPDVMVHDDRGGGDVAFDSVSAGCRGNGTVQASYVVTLVRPEPRFRIAVHSESDTTLMVMLPDGRTICSDDEGGGRDPMIEIQNAQGAIGVWVGNYSSGTMNYRIGFSRRNNLQPSALASMPVNIGPSAGVIPQPGNPQPGNPQPQTDPSPQRPSRPIEPETRVDLSDIEVALHNPAMIGRLVGIWRVGGQEIALSVNRQTLSLRASLPDGAEQTVDETVPPNIASTSVVQARTSGSNVIYWVENASSGDDPGFVLYLKLAFQNGRVRVEQSWSGTYSSRRPRWTR